MGRKKVYGEQFGWRTWGIGRHIPTQQPMLRGQFGQLWPEPEMEARHVPTYGNQASPPHSNKDVPVKECTCGIWVQKLEIDTLRWTYSASINVSGFVKIWGKGLEGAMGYRVRHARIVGPLTIDMKCSMWGPPSLDDDKVLAKKCAEDVVRIHDENGSYICFCQAHIPSNYPMVTSFYDGTTGDRKVFTVNEWAERIVPLFQERYGCEFLMWNLLLED